jgi:hypothetical protein
VKEEVISPEHPLVEWSADLANMAISLRWGNLIDNPLLVFLTGIPVGATIQIEGNPVEAHYWLDCPGACAIHLLDLPTSGDE